MNSPLRIAALDEVGEHPFQGGQTLANEVEVAAVQEIEAGPDDGVQVVVDPLAPLVVAEVGPSLFVQGAQHVGQVLAECLGRVVGVRGERPGGRGPGGQRRPVHPARAGIVPAVGLVAEVHAFLIVDRAAVEDRPVEIPQRGLGLLVRQAERQLVAGVLLLGARRS